MRTTYAVLICQATVRSADQGGRMKGAAVAGRRGRRDKRLSDVCVGVQEQSMFVESIACTVAMMMKVVVNGV